MKMNIFVTNVLYIFFASFFFTCFCIIPSESKCYTPFSWTIHIYDGIQDSQITLHVRSKDDDLGYHNITYNLGYKFDFCENLIHNTLFTGDFFFGTKEAHFDVFDIDVSDFIKPQPFQRSHAYWLLKADGYYLSKYFKSYDDPAWILIGEWS